jgi:hypothetical protein
MRGGISQDIQDAGVVGRVLKAAEMQAKSERKVREVEDAKCGKFKSACF